MFSVFLMMINIIIVFGLHILYLYIAIGAYTFDLHVSINVMILTVAHNVATVNHYYTLVELIHSKIHFINMSNNCKRQLHYTYFFK